MKKYALYIFSLIVLSISTLFCVTAYAGPNIISAYTSSSTSSVGPKADNSAFKSNSVPSMPKGNVNLLASSSVKLTDETGGGLGVKYIDGVLKNTVNDVGDGITQFDGISGMKNSDTYVLQYNYTINSWTPNTGANDDVSMGARVFFRGVEKERGYNLLAFSLFRTSAVLLVYLEGQIVDVPYHVPFNRVNNKEYHITILTSLDSAKIWVDGSLIINATNLPQYDFAIGTIINRAAVTMSDFDLYNVNKDNPSVNLNVVTPAQTMPGDTLKVATSSIPNVIDRYIVTFIICGILGFLSIASLIILTIIIILKKKTAT